MSFSFFLAPSTGFFRSFHVLRACDLPPLPPLHSFGSLFFLCLVPPDFFRSVKLVPFFGSARLPLRYPYLLARRMFPCYGPTRLNRT